MTDELRTTLHRIADDLRPEPVDDDLWQRGRAARRHGHDLALAAVLVLVLVTSVAGVGAWVLTDDGETQVAGTVVAEGAIPSRIVDIPADLEVTTDLAVGRGSAAFISASGDPVVITATDGLPHRLGVPGWDPEWVALALSPDGRTLAYQQASDDGTQVVMLDLETGRGTPVLVHPDDALELAGLSWSPGGSWLAWVASAMDETPPFAGQVRASGRESQRVALPSNEVSVAVADDGTSAIGRRAGGLYIRPKGGDLERVSPDPPGAAGAFSPDGTYLALASSGLASYTLDTSAERVLAHYFPDGIFTSTVDVRPLGWVDERLQLLLFQDTSREGGELVVTTPQVDDASTWRRSVGLVGSGIASSLTLAVDLMPDLDGTSSQQLTHDFQVPQERDISWMIGLGVAAAIAVLLALQWLWRRLRP